MFISGNNTPGYMPDSLPHEHETFDEAKRSVIWCLKHEEECAGTEEEAEQLASFAEEVNLQSGPFEEVCLGRCYWVTTP